MERLFEERAFKIPSLCDGNDCVRCSHKLKDSLEQSKGVEEASLDPSTSTLTLRYNPNIVSFEVLEQKARDLGCALAQRFGHETLTLTGLDCADCAIKLEKSVRRLPGILWVAANFATAKLSVEYETNRVTVAQIKTAIKNLGYGVEEVAADQPEESFWAQHLKTMLTIIAGVFLALGVVNAFWGSQPDISRYFFAISILSGGYFVARSGLYSLRTFSLDMNFLVTVAVVGAMVIGEWLDGAMVVFLFAVGNALESYSMRRTRRVIKGLVELAPRRAHLRTDHGDQTVPVEELKVGDVVIVKPGEKVSVDGVVIAGTSSVSEASVTGESMPVDKADGDRVFAGTINNNGSLEIRTSRISKENAIAKIVHLVEEAQAHKAPTQLFTEKFSRYYTPIILFLALTTAVVLPLVFSLPFDQWVHRGLILLVVACPCSLIISTPVALVSAIGNAARHGILIKGGAYLEAIGSVSVFTFDKTGTLTLGEPKVTDIVSLNGMSQREILELANAIESRSEHPVGRAIAQEALRQGVRTLEINDFQAVPGSGAYARLGDQIYYIGSWKFFSERLLPLTAKPDILHLEEAGKTVVFLGTEKQLVGALAFADTIRPHARESITALRELSHSQIVMLTGDNEPAAAEIAEELGIDIFHAELLPEDKVSLIKKLEGRHGGVAMIGDGINDAPALAAATVGIAMGAAGTDVALETADIALMSDDLSKLSMAVNLSHRSMRIIKQNIIFSLTVVALLVVGTFGGYLNLTLGVLGHEGSALIVIANGMRLLKNSK